jgi:hypothetical protein
MLDSEPSFNESTRGEIPSVNRLTPAERAWNHSITIVFVEPSSNNHIIIGMRSWKTARGQQKHWQSVQASPSRTNFVLVKHGLDGSEERRFITPEKIEEVTGRKIDTLIACGQRNMYVFRGQLSATPVTVEQKRRAAVRTLCRQLRTGRAELGNQVSESGAVNILYHPVEILEFPSPKDV